MHPKQDFVDVNFSETGHSVEPLPEIQTRQPGKLNPARMAGSEKNENAPPGYNDDCEDKQLLRLAPELAQAWSSSSSSSSPSARPLLSPLPSVFAMIPGVSRESREKKTGYYRATNVSYIMEDGDKPCRIVARVEAYQLSHLVAPNRTMEDLHTLLPHFALLPTTVYRTDNGSYKDARFAVMTKPNPNSTWLRILVNPDAVLGVIEDGPQRTTLLVENHGAESHHHPLSIQMPVREAKAVIDQATQRLWASLLATFR
ncbi:hypothetical protein DFJ73DRAFT_814165 [Zopfochytrium polystomum]|nr:hypothetical protein DFJ73DRAFT_814165 [Zopfochytrium polystomum]